LPKPGENLSSCCAVSVLQCVLLRKSCCIPERAPWPLRPACKVILSITYWLLHTGLTAAELFRRDIKQQLVAEAAASGRALQCAECGQRIEDWQLGEAEVDHVQPWSLGGATARANAQLLHK